MFLYFLQGAALALPTTLTPSPFKVFIITQALQNGFRRTVPAAFAPLITDGLIIVLVMLVLIQAPVLLLDLLRIGGGVFLIYLALRLLWSLRNSSGLAPKAAPRGADHSLRQAVVLNLLNPNPYIFWGMIAGPIMLQGLEQSIATGLSFVAGFYTLFVCGLVALIFVFATVGRLNPTVNRLLILVAATGMLVIGANQILTGVRAITGF